MTAENEIEQVSTSPPSSAEQLATDTARLRPPPTTPLSQRDTRAIIAAQDVQEAMVTGERVVRRPVVAVDVDEVLGQFVLQLCSFHNTVYGTNLTPENFTSYNFHDAWGGTKEQADEKVCLFFKSSFFLDGIPVIEGAAEILGKWCDRLELHIVTSRQNVLEEHTRKWITKHYPGIFRKLHFGNHHSKHGKVWSKPELCDAINAVMIIDDNMLYATQCAEAGIKTCLFGDYAWNRSTSGVLHENIRRTFCWKAVDAALVSVATDDIATAAAARALPTEGVPVAVGIGEKVEETAGRDEEEKKSVKKGEEEEGGDGGGGPEQEGRGGSAPPRMYEHNVCVEIATNRTILAASTSAPTDHQECCRRVAHKITVSSMGD